MPIATWDKLVSLPFVHGLRPEVIRAFLAAHGEKLSGLSRREASKYVRAPIR